MKALGIENLWRIQINSIRDQVVSGAKDYLEVANLAEHIGADYHGRFLIELIQNAEDPSRKTSSIAKNNCFSRLIIVRTKSLVAVLNQGKPFIEKDIKAITSLGLSTKNPETSLGNKGVGFKAVFQITDSPEIYSAPESDGTLWSENANRFCMQEKPFSDVSTMQRFSKIVEEEMLRDPARYAALEAISGDGKANEYLIKELQRAAPFKFPKPLTLEDQNRRVEELGLSRETIEKMSTMVVLPLLNRTDATETVNDALDELTKVDHPGSTLLFLTGIGRLWIFDRLKSREVLLLRHERGDGKQLDRGVELRDVTTMERIKISTGCEQRKARWWLATRRFGRHGSDPMTSAEEEQDIAKAVKDLRIATWKDVRSAHAGVALPRSQLHGENLRPLAVDGIFCMGLPTHVLTGLPVWVNGPFHGHISRTRVDFKEQLYNRLILEESIKIFWCALEYIKNLPSADERRHASLVLDPKEGAYQTHVVKYRDPLFQKLILNSKRNGYLSPNEIKVPNEDDVVAFNKYFSMIDDIEQFGFCLPDSILLKNCWQLLDKLAGGIEIEVGDSVYLQRKEGRNSLLENTAQKHRGDGREWWESFLDWIVTRFDFADIQDQCILPVGSDALAAASDRVFFIPLMSIAEDESTDKVTSEEAIDDMDESLLNNLAFLDEECVQVRIKSGHRSLTDLAKKLSPEPGLVLVRNPRRPEIINEVLSPYLGSICTNPKDIIRALSVLAQIADWVHNMRPGPRERIRFQDICVPVENTDNDLDWVAPTGVYFGDGWLDNDTNDLIAISYSEESNKRLVSIESFQNIFGDDFRHELWCNRFSALGVLDAPRLLRVNTGRQIYLTANNYINLTIENSQKCPIPQAVEYWKQYLDKVSNRPTEVKSKLPYFIRDPIWIEGLEKSEARNAVIKLVLRKYEHYSGSLQIRVERPQGDDSRQMPALWVHTIVRQQWSVIPTSIGLLAPSKAWRFSEEMRRTLFARDELIAYVKPPYDQAENILKALGVYSPSDAPVWRVIAELQDVASTLDSLLESTRRSAKALIRELYTWLQDASVRSSELESDLSRITERPIPLLKDKEFVVVDLSADVVILLNDDPERLPYVKNFASAFILPLHARHSNAVLYEALRDVLGQDRVMRASEAEIILEFNQVEPDTPLLDYLIHYLEPIRPTIRRDLAALIAFAGKKPMDPRKEAFREKWTQFDETNIRRGHFNNLEQKKTVFDKNATGGAVLYVPFEHRPEQVLDACWHLLGPSYQHAWENYVRRLETGECDRFFDSIDLNERDWTELDSVIGASQRVQLDRLQPVLLVKRRHVNVNLGVESFLNELQALDLNVGKIASWVDVEKTLLENALGDGSLGFDDERQLPILEMIGVTIVDWQRARRDLGRKPVLFQSTIDLFEEWRANIVAYLRVVVARDVSDHSLLGKAGEILDKLSGEHCPSTLAEQICDQVEVVELIVLEFLSKIDTESKIGSTMVRRLKAIGPIQADKDLSGPRVPRRELTLYRNLSEYQRESDANEAITDVIKVAKALAELNSEDFEEESILSDVSMLPWLKGYWANCFAALRSLRELLRQNAPVTVEKLNEEGVFSPRQRVSWRDLWKLFPELGMYAPKANSAPPKEVEVLGQQLVESELDDIFSQGTDGILGQSLVNAIDSELDMATLASKLRNSISHPDKKPKGRRGGGGGGKTGGRQADEQAGLLGEAFIYESLRNTLPDFDLACWVSDSRRKYGLEGKGDDGLGYDFEYTDVDGKLTGLSHHPHCLIEVKSTTSTQDIPFPMSSNEWAVAGQCYKGARKAQYIIIRVLGVKTAPVIADVVVDPVRLWHEDKLILENRDFIVRPALPEFSGVE